jgi:hypothetical protein
MAHHWLLLQEKINLIKNKIPKKAANFFIVGIVFLFFLFILYKEKDSLLSVKITVTLDLIIEVIGLYLVIVLLSAFVWAKVLNHISRPLPFLFHLRVYCITALGKRIPGTIWYIPWRYRSYANVGISQSEVIAASGLEFFISLISGFIISIIFGFEFVIKNQLSLLLLLIPVSIIFLLFNIRFRSFLRNKYNIDLKKINFLYMAFLTILFMLIWVAVGIFIFLISRLIIGLNFSHISLFIGAVAFTGVLSRIIVFLPTNFGLSEISMSLLLSSIMPMSFSITIALLNRILTTIFEIILAVIFLITGNSEHNPKGLLNLFKKNGQ